MKVTYLDNSGFAIELDKAILVFDYSNDPSHSLHKILDRNPLLPVVFLVSHNHEGHYNTGIYEMAQNHTRYYVISNDVPAKEIPSTLDVAGVSAGDTIDTLPDGITVKAYPATCKGVSFMVTTKYGMKIFHGGDLSTLQIHHCHKDDAKKHHDPQMDFEKALNRIASENQSVTVAMIAVDPRAGEGYTDAASRFMEKIDVSHFFPMHFEGRHDEACDFIYVPSSTTRNHCLKSPGDSVMIE